MPTVGRIKEGDLLLTGDISERSPGVTGVKKIRYIRDWLNGSTSNTGKHWIELQAFDTNGTNQALNKTAKGSWSGAPFAPGMVDGNTDTGTWTGTGMNHGAGLGYIQVDLGDLFEIIQIKVWHFYGDGRTYYDTKTEVSPDGVTWFSVFDSAIQGTYPETSAGRTYNLNLNAFTYIPFDGTLNHMQTLRNAKVAIFTQGANGSFTTWFTRNAGSVVTITDWNAFTLTEAKKYDLVLYDSHVWSISEAIMLKLKSFVDAGVSVVACGNDTRTNVFVSGYQATTAVTHSVTPCADLPFPVKHDVYSGGSTDINGGITGLRNGAYPFYRRTDTGEVTGYLYDSPTGGTLVYDQEGNSSMFPFLIPAFEYALGRSNGSITVLNTTLTENDIAVEEGTTNLVSNPLFDGLSGWTILGDLDDGTFYRKTQIVDTEYGKGLKVRWERRSGSGNQWFYIRNNARYSASGETTLSVKVKILQATNGAGIDIRNAAGENDYGRYGTSGYTTLNSNHVGKGWQDYIIRRNIWGTQEGKNEALFEIYSGPLDQAGEIIEFIIVQPQIEKKAFATSFTPATRGNGRLDIPLTPSSNYTLFYKYSPRVFWPSLSGFTYTNKKVWDLYDQNTGKKIWLSEYFTTGQTESSPWIGHDEFTVNGYPTWHWHQPRKEVANKEYYFALVKNGAVVTKYAFDETGLRKQTTTHTDPALIAFQPKQISFHHEFSARIKDFAYYNRALTEEEIKKLAKQPHQVTSEGRVFPRKIIEKPVGVPSDAIYLPLDLNARHPQLIPSEEVNMSYDGAAWVGGPYENLFEGNVQVHGATVVKEEGWSKYTYTTVNAFCSRHYVTLSKLANGNTYTISATVYNPMPKEVAVAIDWCDNWVKYTLKPFETRRIYQSASRTTYDSTYRFGDITPYTVGDQIWIKDVMINKHFDRPFVKSAATASELEFNLYRDCGLDWSKDWSIVYWKKPMGTQLDTLAGYNIESLGCNSNTEGGGYVYWGKQQNADAIFSATPNTINPATYFNRWRMVSLTKTNASISIKEWDYNGTVYTRSIGTTATVPNFYVTQFGYDFKLGGWDNGNSVNSYYRDLMVVKRQLSNTELETLFKTQMRVTGDGLTIQNSIKDNQFLS